MKGCLAAAHTQGMSVTSGADKKDTNNMSFMYTGDFIDQSEVPAVVTFFFCALNKLGTTYLAVSQDSGHLTHSADQLSTYVASEYFLIAAS